jgi:hypothetical protein
MEADNFHRLTKVLADSGESPTLEAAANTFASYGVRVVLDARVAGSIVDQVIALTVINTAARSFLGNVEVVAPVGLQLTAPGFEGQSLTNFLDWAGVKKKLPAEASGLPTIEVGEPVQTRTGGIRAWADGWTYGIGAHDGGQATFFAPACVAAAGLAVSEAFSVLRRDNPYAGRRSLGLSLWKPELRGDVAKAQGPADPLLPSVWLVGLGHLGQAYAWTMAFMKATAGAEVFLQDIDVVTRSTLSTSVLSNEADLGRQKTRVAAAWLEARGFTTHVVERRFDGAQRIASSEPQRALFGVDNAAARRVLENAGFAHVVDAGLGSGFKDFRAMRVRTFPGPSSAAALWASQPASKGAEQAPAYRHLLAAGADPCGVTTLATRSVGAPFVGCVAAGHAIAAIQRHAAGESPYPVVDMNLRDPHRADVVAP